MASRFTPRDSQASSMLSFSGSTRSSESDWARCQDGIPYLTTADGEEASAADLHHSKTLNTSTRLAIPVSCATRSEALSETSRSSRGSPLTYRRFSTNSLQSARNLALSLETDTISTPVQRPSTFTTYTPKASSHSSHEALRRTRSLDFEASWPEGGDWLELPQPPQPNSVKDEVSDAEEAESSLSLPLRTPSGRALPLRRTLSSDCLPSSKAFRANLLDFDSVKSYHHFYTKPATLRDRHLFWNAFWRAIFFPFCKPWWLFHADGQTVSRKQFLYLSLLYFSHLALVCLYLLDALPGLDSYHISEKCFWDLWRPCITLVLFAVVHADVVAVAIPRGHRKARGHGPSNLPPIRGLGYKVGDREPDDELCSDGSDSMSDCDDALHRHLQFQQSMIDISVNAHRWTPDGHHRKDTLTLKEFRNVLSSKVSTTKRSPLNIMATRICLLAIPLWPWMLTLLMFLKPCPEAWDSKVCRAESLPLSTGDVTSGLVGVVSTVCMFCLTSQLLHHLAQAELTFSRRLVYARYFKSITSSGKARRYGVPHFSLKNGANIRFWLALRGGRPWLAQHAEQRAADVVATICFFMSCLLLGALLLVCGGKGDFPHSQADWDIVVCSATLSFWMLRYLVIGSQINAKYSDTTVLLTEQINLQLRMLVADSPEKLDRLKVTSNVLKVATKLLQELGKPTKISGLAMNKNFYNLMRVVVLSALSAALSEPLGFKVRLTTLAKMK